MANPDNIIYEKMNINVLCEHKTDGSAVPLRLRLDDGRIIIVDKFICRERAASTKVGGCGMRYSVIINGLPKYLFEDDGIWYVEAKKISP